MAATHRLRELREKAGLDPRDIAQVVGVTVCSAYDLDEHDSDMFVGLTLGQLRSLCAALGATPSELFPDAAPRESTTCFESPRQVADAVARHLNDGHVSLEGFEDAVGWGGVGSVRGDPEDLFNWCVDMFVSVCDHLGRDWVASLDAIFVRTGDGETSRTNESTG